MVKKYPITKLFLNNKYISEIEKDVIMAKGESEESEIEAISEAEVMSEKNIAINLSKLFDMKYIDLEDIIIEQDLLDLIPNDIISRLLVVPFKQDEKTVSIAICDPTDFQGLESLYYYTNKKIIFYIAEQSLVTKRYLMQSTQTQSTEAIETLRQEFGDLELTTSTNILNDDSDAPSIKLTNSVLSEAIAMNASDIHVEPYESHLSIRYRVDGILKEMMHLPSSIAPALTARFKMISGMDISERRTPQEGRLEVELMGKPVDLRFSTLPNVFGEKIVIRILQKDIMDKNVDKLGFNEFDYKSVQKMLKRNDGIILVTGPTGSGKSTTLYSFLNEIKTSEKAIVTVEDPVEYTIEGFNQTQVNTKKGMTFPLALRAILRQDPDIIMIGEIRDEETANIAVRSSITGHLVLSTLHTNSALSSIIRLVDMGIRPYLISDALRGVIAQRLLRRLCPECKMAYTSSVQEMKDLGQEKPVTLYRAVGCNRCNQIGYKGRFPVFEVLYVSLAMRKLIQEEADADVLEELAKKENMTLLYERGVESVLEGKTTMQELRGLYNGE